MDISVRGAGAAVQGDGVAQPFAATGEVPHAAVVPAVHMAARTGDVAFGAHAAVAGVVENFLPALDGGRHQFGDGGGHVRGRDVQRAGAEEGFQFEHGHVAAHQVHHEGAARDRVHAHPLRRAAHGAAGEQATEAGGAFRAEGVEDGEVVVALERGEKEVAQRGQREAAGGIAVVDVERAHDRAGGEVDEDDQVAHGVVVVQVRSAGGAFLRVRLGRGDEQARAVAGDGGAGQVVGHPHALGAGVAVQVAAELVDAKGAQSRERGGVHLPDLGVIFQRKEAGHVKPRTIGVQRQRARRGAKGERAGGGAGRGVEAYDFAAAIHRDVSRPAVGGSDDAERRAAVAHGERQHGAAARGHDVNPVGLVARHPGVAGRVERHAARVRAHAALSATGERVGVDGLHGVVVRVHHPHLAVGRMERDWPAVARAETGRGTAQDRHVQRARGHQAGGVAHLHGGGIMAVGRVAVGGRRGCPPGRARRAVAEVEAVFQGLSIGVGRARREGEQLIRRRRVSGDGERFHDRRAVAPDIAPGREGEGVRLDAVVRDILDATADHDDFVGGVGEQTAVGRDGERVIEGEHPARGDGLAAERAHDEVRAELDGFGAQGLVNEEADGRAGRVVRLAGARDVVADGRAAPVGFGLVRPDGHALIGAGATGDKEVADGQGELADIHIRSVRPLAAGIEAKHGAERAHVHLVAAEEGEFILELHIHALVAGQRDVGDEAEMRRVGHIHDPHAVARFAIGEDDVELAVAAPQFGPVTAGAAGLEHVEQHGIARVADVVGGHASAALVGGVDEDVADDEGMADEAAGLAEMVEGGERPVIVAQNGGAALWVAVIAPVSRVDAPRLIQMTADIDAEHLGR